MTDIVLVTGTDTGVGKTVVAAAIAAAAGRSGRSVAVLKPAESGAVSGESDVDTVLRLAAPTTAQTLMSYPDPLAPLIAAQESGLPELAIGDVIEAVDQIAAGHDLVLIEGAGGLLVPMGEGAWTVADLAVALRIPAVVVARAGLGTLNHTALTFEAMANRGIAGSLVIGCWPAEPELVHWTNLISILGDLAGVVPEGAPGLPPPRFQATAAQWLAPSLFGHADPDLLRADGVTLRAPTE